MSQHSKAFHDIKAYEGRNCSIWLCSNATIQECLEKGLFGDRHDGFGRDRVRTGDICFLLNCSNDQLLGVFEAVSDPAWNLDPGAWGGKFPWQIRVRPLGEVRELNPAKKIFEQIGLELTQLRGGAWVPRFGVYGPVVTRQLLARFPSQAFAEGGRKPKEQNHKLMIQYLTFRDVAGLEDVKDFIRQRLIEPFLYPQLARAYGLRIGGGLLLYGPPGTGKTLVARATAGEIEADFLEITPSVVKGFPGEPERHLEGLFEEAMRRPRVVIFFDEADALLARRENIHASTVMQRIVPTLLSLFSQVADKGAPVLIIGATNQPWNIDEAFLRPGRFDRSLYVGPPDRRARVELLRLKLRHRPVASDLMSDRVLEELASQMEGWTGADIEALLNHVAFEAFRKTRDRLGEALKPDDDVPAEDCVPITAEDILSAIRKNIIQPSLNEDQLRRYEEWRRP